MGEPVVLYCSDRGNWLCPVCATEWFDSSDWLGELFLECLDVCNVCNTQIGNEDVDEVPANPENPPEKRWAKLRTTWLERSGYQAVDIRRLEDVFGIDM